MRALCLALVLASVAPARAQAPDPFVAVADADPMELARVVDRLGDGAVLARLAAERAPAVRLAATRAAPFLDAPEHALEPLSRLAAGRDPRLAPAAARAALTIARALDLDALSLREFDPAALAPARERFAALAADASARADLRAVAGLIVARLSALTE